MTSRNPRSGVSIALWFVLAAQAAIPAWAQDEGPESPLPGVFGEIVDVRVVNIEVVVTDKQGTPVTGLTADDFQLIVDGEEVEIGYFSEVVDGVAARGREGQTARSSVPSIVPGDAVGTSYLVFIDEFFSRPHDRDRVLDSLAQHLSAMRPSDRMAIVAYDGDDLEMLSSWSQSKADLGRVLEAAKERKTYGMQRLFEQRQVRLDLVSSFAADNFIGENATSRLSDLGGMTPFERSYVRRLTSQVSETVFAARHGRPGGSQLEADGRSQCGAEHGLCTGPRPGRRDRPWGALRSPDELRRAPGGPRRAPDSARSAPAAKRSTLILAILVDLPISGRR